MNVPHRSSRYLAMYILRYSTVNMFVAKLTNRITDLCSSCRLQYFALLKDCADLVIACWSSKCLVMSCTNKKQITFPHFPFYCIELKHRIVAHRTPRVQISHLTTANNPTGHLGNAPAHSRGMCASEICAFDMSMRRRNRIAFMCAGPFLLALLVASDLYQVSVLGWHPSSFFLLVVGWYVFALWSSSSHIHFTSIMQYQRDTPLYSAYITSALTFLHIFVLCQGKCLRCWR